MFIKRGCASLADDTSITEEEIKNYRNVAFLYINFKEKSVLNEKPFLFLLFVQKMIVSYHDISQRHRNYHRYLQNFTKTA